MIPNNFFSLYGVNLKTGTVYDQSLKNMYKLNQLHTCEHGLTGHLATLTFN